MVKRWISTQIVLENFFGNSWSEDIFLKKKLSLAKKSLDLDSLIIWPDRDKKNLSKVLKFCTDLKIKTYLWYPLLSDIPTFKIKKGQAVETYNGLLGYGINGIWEKLGQVGEDFLFLCPNDQKNINRIFFHFQRQISEECFDGVFFDRIRFPSPANGLETIFSCFCQWCQKKYFVDYQGNLKDFQKQIGNYFREFKVPHKNHCPNGTCLTDILNWENFGKFYDFKKKSIYQLIKMFAEEAKKRGMLVSLDLFSPSLAPIVSQDYRLLASICDWIKPMFYCHTNGPAGIPLELFCLIKGLINSNYSLKEEELMEEMSQMLGVQLPKNINSLLKNGVPEEVIYFEWQKIKDYNLGKDSKIYAGIEAVQITGICQIDKKILERYLNIIMDLDLDGIVLSWNLLQIPDENIIFIGNLLLNQ